MRPRDYCLNVQNFFGDDATNSQAGMQQNALRPSGVSTFANKHPLVNASGK